MVEDRTNGNGRGLNRRKVCNSIRNMLLIDSPEVFLLCCGDVHVIHGNSRSGVAGAMEGANLDSGNSQ